MGTVTDKTTGKPIKDARVETSNARWPKLERTLSSAVTDASGRYQMHVLPGKTIVMCFAGNGSARELTNVDVAANATVTVDFQAEESGKF
jgi:hypothetical protein